MGANKNRPNWLLPRGHGPKAPDASAMLAKRTPFGTFTPESGRRQCVAVAKATGERCGNAALRGSDHCRLHGGHRAAMARAPEGSVSAIAGRHAVRQGLAKIGASEPLPPVSPVPPLSPIDRGKLVEAWRNRALAPDALRVALTARTRAKTKG
jgi:hypothetical protein